MELGLPKKNLKFFPPQYCKADLSILQILLHLSCPWQKKCTGIELNQGDTIGGTVGRADVAEVVVEAALSPATENTIFEVYGESDRD